MNFNQEEYNLLAIQHINHRSRKSLKDIREYLDAVGYQFPKPKYKYVDEDKKTHKYLESIINTKTINGKETFQVREVLNKSFAYKEV